MAKQVQLKQNGVEIYPQTITQAIADTTKGKLLSTIITELYSGITKETTDRIAAINALDYTGTSAVTGQYVKTITETDGIIAATFGQVAASEVSNTSTKSAISDKTTVQAALDALADKAAAQEVVAKDASVVVAPITSGADSGKTGVNVNIKSGEKVLLLNANDGLYTDIKLSAVTVADTNVKEAWALIGSDGSTQLGSTIKIYKDSAYKEIYLGTSADTINPTTGEITKQDGDKQSLNYAYMKADGSYDLVKVDVSAFIAENEYADGLQVVNGIISVKKDSTSEGFLSISSNGVKISGVTDAITNAINELDATKSGETTYINVQVTEADGKITGVAVTDKNAVIATSGAMESLAETGHLADAKAVKDYVDAKTGSLDSTVSGQTADGFIKVEVDQADGALNYVHVTGTTQAMASADASHTGLAEASDVKTYVDGQIEALDANVSGESGAVKVQVVEANGVITNVNVTATTANMADAGLTGTELAKTKDVKDYVDSAITKTAIIDSADIDATESAAGTSLAIKYGSIASGATSAVTGGSIFAWGVTAEDKATITDFTWPTA